MGCKHSIPDSAENNASRFVRQGASEHVGAIADLPSAHPKAAVGRQSWKPMQFSQVDEPPSYNDDDLHKRIIKSYQAAGKQFLLASMAQWDHHIIVDDRSRTPAMIKDGICLLSWIVLAFLQACDASITLSFMNYMNPDPSNLSKGEKEAAMFINKLYNCKTVSDVTDMLEDKVPEYLRSRDLPQKVALIMSNTQIKPPQRHPRILALIRDMRYDLSDPWVVSDMDVTEFMKHFADANEADKEQAKVLSSLSFTAIRSIQSVKKDYQERKLDKTSTVARRKIIIVTGTSISPSRTESHKTGAEQCRWRVLRIFHPSCQSS